MIRIKEAKQFILDNIYPKISYSNHGSTTPRLKNKLFEIIKEHNPKLLSDFKLSKLNIKYHLLYCFLNDINITKYTKHYNIDDNLNRIIDNISLEEFANKYWSIKGKPRGLYDRVLIKHGFDIKYPKLLKYDKSEISKILRRILAEHKECLVCCTWFRSGHRKSIAIYQRKLCSDKCFRKHRSIIQMGSNNTIHRMTKESKITAGRKISKKINAAILEGRFTPCVTNSWANSKVYLKIFNMNFRSTWEAYFYLFNIHNDILLEYEKIRIPYYDTQEKRDRIYITDFSHTSKKIIYEIKPISNKILQNVLDKR